VFRYRAVVAGKRRQDQLGRKLVRRFEGDGERQARLRWRFWLRVRRMNASW